MKHVTRSQLRLAFGINLPISSKDITIAANNFLRFRIPHNELFTTVLHGVKLIDIHCLARTSSCCTKGLFSKTPYFHHDMRSFFGRNDIDFIMALVCHSQLTLGS